MADAIFTLGGCDKTVPAALMPIPRSNLIGITLYSGAAQPGHHHEVRDGAGLDAADVMEAIGSYGTGQIDIEELHKIECVSLPGSGCGAPQHGLSFDNMALITSDCGTICYPSIKWTISPRVVCPGPARPCSPPTP